MALNFACCVAIVVFLLISTFSSIVIESKINDLTEKNDYLKTNLENIREEKFGFDIDENMILELTRYHNNLTKETTDPTNFLVKFANIHPKKIKLTSYLWKYDDNNNIKFEYSGKFIAKNMSYEGIFSLYDNYIRRIKKEFSEYRIEHSDLPDTFTFAKSIKDIDVNIRIYK